MLNTAVLIAGLAIAQLTAEKPPQAQPPAPKPAPTAPATPAPKPPAPTATPTAPRQTVPSRTTMTITVTDRQGRPLSNVTVRATGPTEREGTTDPEGNVTLRNAAPGTYRLRFDHESHVSFEKEITVAGRPARTTAELTAAPPPPPPPPPPKPEPAPAPPTSASSQVPPSGPPSSVAIPDFYEKNQIGRAPFKSSPVGCTATATASLLQLRDPLAEHSHNDADEMLYVVAGSGVQRIGGIEVNLAAGTFIVIPRGTPHSVTRRGGNPLLLVSILTGPPCDPAKNK